MTQICTKCKKQKDETEFNWRNKDRNIRQRQCKECTRGASALHYFNNQEYYNAKARRFQKKHLQKLREKIREYLSSHPCVDCNETDFVVLQFDHVRGTKTANIGHLMRRHATWSTIEQEIAKCEVRCANCHVRRTAIAGKWHRLWW